MARTQVRSLTGQAFATACAELLRQVEERFAPALLIGIRTGGYTVAVTMHEAAGRPLDLAPLTCRRASTRTKAGIPGFAAVLPHLPTPVLDQLRRFEHRLLTRRRPPGARTLDPAEATALRAKLAALPPGSKVVAVDDAVDSGGTLAAVMEFAQEAAPAGVTVHSAAITVTTDKPISNPDITLFHGVLCRFPWSFDAA